MYSKLEPHLKEEVIDYDGEEFYCCDIMNEAKEIELSRKHRYTDEFASPMLYYVEPDRIISLDVLKRTLLKFFYTWRSTVEALDFLIVSVSQSCIESRIYFCEKTGKEPAVGNIIGLWWSAMPENGRLRLPTMYGHHEFEDWIVGTRPNMQKKLYLAQLLFVLQDIRREFLEYVRE